VSSRASLPGLLVVFLATAGSLSGGPAVGDWLVTSGGSAVETRGSWEVKGRLVIFHTADGTFASMRLNEVDLGASEARTEAAAKAKSSRPSEKPVPAPPAPSATFVLTDADVGHVDPATLASRAAARDDPEADTENRPAAAAAAEGEVMAKEDNPLEVISWDVVLGANSDGVRIRGVVRNPSEFFASDISLDVTVLDLEGGEIEARIASMEADALAPGEQGEFEVSFPGVFTVGDALFEVTSFNAVVSR